METTDLPALNDGKTPPRVSPKGHAVRKPDTGPPALTRKHKLLAEYMVHGTPRDLPQWKIKAGVPLPVDLAARAAGLRLRNARELIRWPIWQAAYAERLKGLREGHKAAAMHKIIEVAQGTGKKAADRKVQLDAAAMILGDDIKPPTGRNGVTVNVAVTPGYVIGRNSREEQRPTIVIDAVAEDA